jgi:hypothetical protein
VASLKDGHIVTYNGKQWVVGISDQLLDDLIQQKSDILEEKYDEIVDKLSPMESKKFNNFINRKDDEKVNLKLKRELRVQLYNNRHFAKDARKFLEEKAKTMSDSLKDEDIEKKDKIQNAIEALQNLDSLEKVEEVIKILNS